MAERTAAVAVEHIIRIGLGVNRACEPCHVMEFAERVAFGPSTISVHVLVDPVHDGFDKISHLETTLGGGVTKMIGDGFLRASDGCGNLSDGGAIGAEFADAAALVGRQEVHR